MPQNLRTEDQRPNVDVELDRPSWLTVDVWPHRLRSHHDRGHVLHYVDEGPDDPDAPTLVLLHAGTWSFIWRDLIARLAPNHRCLSIDFPGAGLSTGGPDDIDLASFAGIVDRWLDHLGIERATFVIHDLGGLVGIAAAAAKPERVDGLVVINSFAWPAETSMLRAMLGLMGSRTMTATLGNLRTIPRMTRTRFGVGRHYDRADRAAFYGPYAGRPERGRGFHRAMASARRSSDLAERAASALASTLAELAVLTIFGERNDPFGFGDRWQTLFPSAIANVVPGGNHFPMCDAPDEVAGWIEDWFATRSRVRGRSGPTPGGG